MLKMRPSWSVTFDYFNNYHKFYFTGKRKATHTFLILTINLYKLFMRVLSDSHLVNFLQLYCYTYSEEVENHSDGIDIIFYSPVKYGNSENHIVENTISVMLCCWTICTAGTWNIRSKQMKWPNVTPKSVLKIPKSGDKAGVRVYSPNKFILRYLKYKSKISKIWFLGTVGVKNAYSLALEPKWYASNVRCITVNRLHIIICSFAHNRTI